MCQFDFYRVLLIVYIWISNFIPIFPNGLEQASNRDYDYLLCLSVEYSCRDIQPIECGEKFDAENFKFDMFLKTKCADFFNKKLTRNGRISQEKRNGSSCTFFEFSCLSDKSCIDNALVCDGLKDCSDGSDETEQQCAQMRCEEDKFRCTYGGCVSLSAKCDGRVDCADNSDETNADCPPIVNQVNSTVLCNTSQFQCSESRNCIDKELLCDGKGDCDDNSDETVKQCENIICSSSEFRCDYGACINASSLCDKKKDCFDGSDEFEKTCFPDDVHEDHYKEPNFAGGAFNFQYFPPREDSGYLKCDLPAQFDSPNSQMRITCPKETPMCTNWTSREASSQTEVKYHCEDGYALPGGINESLSVCWSGKWLPQFQDCIRTCRVPKLENVDLTCTYRGNIIQCRNNMLVGTSIRPRCKAYHRLTHPVHYRQIHCESSGKWTDELFKCVPDCGKPVTSRHVKLLTANASVEEFGEAPWHVAIYNVKDLKNRQLICGGTLISPYLVVSAAHCFFRHNIQKLNNASDYEIAVSKYSRQYSKKDNRYTRKYKIREIILPNDTYTGFSTRYSSDIVILWIKKKISLNGAVMPACVPWTEDKQFSPGDGSLGVLSGIGKTENGTASESRRIVQLPFVGRNKCIKSLHEDFKDIVTLDKFCAGSEKGPGAREGESGGGLLFKNPDLGVYYLQGIVSIKEASSSSVAVFTSINSYLDWMDEVRVRVQRTTI